MGKVISLLIIVFWLTMMTLLVSNEVVPYLRSEQPISAERIFSSTEFKDDKVETEMGIYWANNRLGSYTESIIRNPNKTYTMKFDTVFTSPFLKEQLSGINSECRFTHKGELIDFNAEVQISGGGMTIKGVREGDFINVESNMGGEITHKKLDYSKYSTVSTGLAPFVNTPNLETGKEWKIYWMDPFSGRMRSGKATVESRKSIMWQDKLVTAYLVQLEYDRVVYKAWLDTKGRLLKQVLPMGLIIIRESPLPEDEPDSTADEKESSSVK